MNLQTIKGEEISSISISHTMRSVYVIEFKSISGVLFESWMFSFINNTSAVSSVFNYYWKTKQVIIKSVCIWDNKIVLRVTIIQQLRYNTFMEISQVFLKQTINISYLQGCLSHELLRTVVPYCRYCQHPGNVAVLYFTNSENSNAWHDSPASDVLQIYNL